MIQSSVKKGRYKIIPVSDASTCFSYYQVMGTAATNDCVCCDSLKVSSILAKIDIFLWILLLISTFLFQKDLKDPIWLASTISIFVFLNIITGLEIYALSSKNFCLILSSALSRSFFITCGNLAVIILAFWIPNMHKDLNM